MSTNVSVDTQFHAVYLLTSLDPLCQQSSYIGYTVEPERRLRQHNGELVAGAKKTARGRPWKMELCVIGFCNKHAALRFEWQWQHPLDASQSMRNCFNRHRRYIGFQYAYKARIAILHELLNSNIWKNCMLTLHFFGKSRIRYDTALEEIRNKILLAYRITNNADSQQSHSKRKVTILQKYSSILTTTVQIQSGDFDDVQKVMVTPSRDNKVYDNQNNDLFSLLFTENPVRNNDTSPVIQTNDTLCALCDKPMQEITKMKCPSCVCAVHILCLADWFETNTPRGTYPHYAIYNALLPRHVTPCPGCRKESHWNDYVRVYKSSARLAAREVAVQEKADYRARYALFRKASK